LQSIDKQAKQNYCKGKWGITKQSAYQLISGAAVSKNIKSHNCDFQPTKQSQTRPLTKLPADKQSEAWAKSVESAGGQQPTAKQVEAAAFEIVQKEPISPEEPAPTENVPSEGMTPVSNLTPATGAGGNGRV